MKHYLLLFLLLSVGLQAQTHRFIYEFQYKKDSLSEKMSKFPMVLDITNDEVLFYEYQAIKMDSINKNMDGFSHYSFPFAKLKRQLVAKENKNYYFIGDAYFVFESNDEMNWNVLPDTKLHEQWKLQKATTNFGGRQWEAWFTADIPFSEGPYKFNGLPGLIVELRDAEGNFSYVLGKIEKPANANTEILETLFKIKPLPVTYEKYRELMIADYNDPYFRYRSMREGTWSIGRVDGSSVRTHEGLTKLTREQQEIIRKNNNPIERDKAIRYRK